jgi:hypothetical protein
VAVILSLLKHKTRSHECLCDWTNDEVAELYRVERALCQANIAIETERGVTDEGDPWFVFCRRDGEVIVHIARYGGLYHLFSPALPAPLEGPTFSTLTRAFVSVVPTGPESGAMSGVVFHPSALLSLLVVSIYFSLDYLSVHGGRAEAAPIDAAKALPVGERSALRCVVANMLSAVNVSEADEVMQSAYLAGQGAVAFFGADVVANGQAVAYAGVSAQTAQVDVADVAAILSAELSKLAAQANAPPLAGTETAATAPQNNVAAAAVDWGNGAALNPSSALTVVAVDGLAPPASAVSVNGSAGATASAVGLAVAAAESSRIIVAVSSQANQLNLGSADFVKEIELVGNGEITLSGLKGDGVQTIDVVGGSVETLKLGYASNGSMVKQTLNIVDGSSVTLESITVSNTASQEPASGQTESTGVDLVVNSGGSHTNTLTVADAAITSTTLHLTVVGSQNVVLNEYANTLENSTLDASALQGNLTVGIDLSDPSQQVPLLGSADFVVKDNDAVALLHVPNNAEIQFGTSLESVMTLFDGAAATRTLNLGLESTEGGHAGVSIGIASIDGVTELNLTSEGAASNTVGAIIDSSLQLLNIQGDGSLAIGSLDGLDGGDLHNVTIDASKSTGGIAVNLGQIDISSSGGRTITVIGGQGDLAISGAAASENLVLNGGTGMDHLGVAAGAESVTVTGWHAGDTVSVGAGATTDVVVDATHLASSVQSFIDSLTLQAAATTAAASLPHDSSAPQAVLFEHSGGLYVFVDANGDHHFDPNTDALVHIVGTVNLAELQNAFQSA